MKDLKEKLNKVISSKPDTLQFAKDRKFEKAWIIPQTTSLPSKKEINIYLTKDSYDLLIAEYIWNSKEDDKRFVFTLFLDKKCTLKDHRIFMNIMFDLFYNYQDFNYFIDSINSKVVGSNYLLRNPVESVTLGIFNHWFSVGPVEIWKKGEQYNFEKAHTLIKSRPEIEKTYHNYQGLFFRFNIDGLLNGPYYGIKTPCCKKEGSEWLIDYEKVDYWMDVILS